MVDRRHILSSSIEWSVRLRQVSLKGCVCARFRTCLTSVQIMAIQNVSRQGPCGEVIPEVVLPPDSDSWSSSALTAVRVAKSNAVSDRRRSCQQHQSSPNADGLANM